MAGTNTMDLTQGRPIWQIFLFSIPLVLGTLFQQMYSFVDTVMVGRIIGSWLSVAWLGFTGICFSNPMAWSCGLIYCVVLVVHLLQKRQGVH